MGNKVFGNKGGEGMKASHSLQVLEYIKEHGSITSLEAIRAIGCTRLSGRIYDLKKMGYDIDKTMQEVPTRDGTARVAVYTLRE